jgi:hypothetical protein
MKTSPHVVLKGKFSMELTPLSDGQIASQILSDGFESNAVGLGIAIGQLINWFLDACEEELAKVPSLALDDADKRLAFNAGMLTEIQLGIMRSLEGSFKVPNKGKQQ